MKGHSVKGHSGVLLGLVRWWGRVVSHQPAAWLTAGVVLLSAPLAGAWVPLGDVGHDPALGFARNAAVFVGVLAVAWSLAGLTQHEPFLRLVPARTRWAGTVQFLTLGALLLQAVLFAGAGIESAGWGGEAGARGTPLSATFLLGVLAVDLHLAALGSIALAVPASVWVRVGLFLSLAWFLPALEVPAVGPVLDPGRYLPWSGSMGPAEGGHAATLLGLLATSYLLGTPRALPSPPRGPDPVRA